MLYMLPVWKHVLAVTGKQTRGDMQHSERGKKGQERRHRGAEMVDHSTTAC